LSARVLLGTAVIPDTRARMRLYQSGERFSIAIPGRGDLMNSHAHGSERALAELGCRHIAKQEGARILVGGLGLGFTLAAALGVVGPQTEVVVAELVPEVIEWNRALIGAPSGHPLADPRTTVHCGDVGVLLRDSLGHFDAILLDVDNGPEALIRQENNWLYSPEGLAAANAALRPGGVLAVWSASADRGFSRRLHRAGFDVREETVRPHRAGKGARHHIWVAGRRTSAA
jgi:spermidine synthase